MVHNDPSGIAGRWLQLVDVEGFDVALADTWFDIVAVGGAGNGGDVTGTTPSVRLGGSFGAGVPTG